MQFTTQNNTLDYSLQIELKNRQDKLYVFAENFIKNKKGSKFQLCDIREFVYKLLNEYMKIDNQNTYGWYNDDYLEVVQEVLEFNLNLDFEIKDVFECINYIYSFYKKEISSDEHETKIPIHFTNSEIRLKKTLINFLGYEWSREF